MKTSDFKKGKKVKLIPWKTAFKLYQYDKSNEYIRVPYGDNNGTHIWCKRAYNNYTNKTLTMLSIDIDNDIIVTGHQTIQPVLLRNIIPTINFKSILSHN